MDHRRGPRSLALHAPAESGVPPSRPAGGCGNPEVSLSGNSEPSRAGLPAGGETRAAFGRRSIPPKQPVVKPTRRSAGDPSRPNNRWRNPRGVRPAIHPGQTTGDETHAAFGPIPAIRHPGASVDALGIPDVNRAPRPSTWVPPPAGHRVAFAPLIVALRSIHSVFLPHAPCQPGASRPRRSRRVPPPAVHRVAARRSSLRFGRNTLGPVPRWGLLPHAPCQPGASPPPGELAGLGAHVGSTTGCSPRRFAPLIVAFGRNTPGPVGGSPSRALSAGPPPGELGLPGLGAHPGFTTGWYRSRRPDS